MSNKVLMRSGKVVRHSGGKMFASAPPAGTSALAVLAAGMSGNSWATLTGVSSQNAVLGVGTDQGSVTWFSNSAAWIPQLQKIAFVGADHGYPQLRYQRWRDSDNTWELAADNAGVGSGHGYDFLSCDAATGMLYFLLYNGSSVNNVKAMKCDTASVTFTTVPDGPLQGLTNTPCGCVWTGANTFSGASAGHSVFLVFNSYATSNGSGGQSDDGQMNLYDIFTDTWTFLGTGYMPFDDAAGHQPYDSAMEYSSVYNCAIYGGSNNNPNRLRRLNSDGTSTAMPNCPTGTQLGITHGNLACDPVSGKFLLLSNDEFWELDPSGSGTWTQMATPPSGISPGPSPTHGTISAAVSDYGVVVYINQEGALTGTMRVYKHA